MPEAEQVETTTQITEQPTETVEALKAKLAEQEKHIRDLNRESADRRKKLEAFELAEQQRKEAEMTEAQKLEAKIKAAEQRAVQLEQEKTEALSKAQQTLIRSMVLVKASNFHDPADAWQYVDKSKLTVNEQTGEVEGVEKALEELSKAKPYLLKEQPQQQRSNGTPPGKQPASGNKKPAEIPVMKINF